MRPNPQPPVEPLPRAALDTLPQQCAGEAFARVRRQVGASRTKTVVLDDDPTGTQTVHGLDILADWSVVSLAAAVADPRPCFFVLTNTRSLPKTEAAARVLEVARNLSAAARAAGVDVRVLSRGDSTLRGHFAAELDSIERGLGAPIDARIVIPAFFEGGRYTIGNVHYVAEGETLVPAGQTEFARDRTFGYRNSDLTQWIEEATGGSVRAGDVASVGIAALRASEGAAAVRSRLMGLPRGAHLVVNAAAYSDLEVFTEGLLGAEAAGRRYLVRTAASFVRVRAAVEPRPLMAPGEVRGPGAGGGLVVVGSYTHLTTVQLQALLELPGAEGTEVAVDALVAPGSRDEEILRCANAAREAIRCGRHAVLFTSRKRESAAGPAGDLDAGRIVSDALVRIVRAIPERPRFLIAKGGVTSCGVAIRALGMRKATVLGQASPGVPVWEMGPETRHPGMRLVLWPGNVGGAGTLRDLVRSA
jgi:uncharacterized protein YgbK (DUF1537 family)